MGSYSWLVYLAKYLLNIVRGNIGGGNLANDA